MSATLHALEVPSIDHKPRLDTPNSRSIGLYGEMMATLPRAMFRECTVGSHEEFGDGPPKAKAYDDLWCTTVCYHNL